MLNLGTKLDGLVRERLEIVDRAFSENIVWLRNAFKEAISKARITSEISPNKVRKVSRRKTKIRESLAQKGAEQLTGATKLTEKNDVDDSVILPSTSSAKNSAKQATSEVEESFPTSILPNFTEKDVKHKRGRPKKKQIEESHTIIAHGGESVLETLKIEKSHKPVPLSTSEALQQVSPIFSSVAETAPPTIVKWHL